MGYPRHLFSPGCSAAMLFGLSHISQCPSLPRERGQGSFAAIVRIIWIKILQIGILKISVLFFSGCSDIL